jgi:hypothetical protein
MPPNRKLGRVLIAVGILVILVDVLWMLEVGNGPGRGPTTFVERRSYDQVKEALHDVYPIGFVIGLAGLGLALLGGRLARGAAAPPA